MNKVQYKGLNTQVGPSPALWADVPILETMQDPAQGFMFFDDFIAPPVILAAGAEGVWGPYRFFSDTGTTAAQGAALGGVLTLGSDGDNEGASIGMNNPSWQIDRALGKLVFEARIKSSSITDTKHGFFLGLMDATALSATVPIAAAGTLADANFVGFHRLEGDGDYVDTVYKANGVTQVTVDTDAQVLVADTYIKLGMIFNPINNELSFWADGEKLTETYTIPAADGTDFPNDVRLAPVFAVLNATATAPGTVSMDWWRIWQARVA
jgi:hypothetical protein